MVIPPSIIMVIYGVATETSVGALLVAGVLPGLVYTGVFALAIWLFALLKPSSAPVEKSVDTSWNARVQSLNKLKDVVILFGVSIGGIYVGIVTPTEGAALGAVAALAITFVKKQTHLGDLQDNGHGDG